MGGRLMLAKASRAYFPRSELESGIRVSLRRNDLRCVNPH